MKLLVRVRPENGHFVASLHDDDQFRAEGSSRDLAISAAAKAKAHGKQVVVGGGVSVLSLPFFRAFPAGHLDRFETRKVIFGCPGALGNSEGAFLKAVEFELLWLKNKKDYYGAIHHEDDARLEMMEKRYRDSINTIRCTP